MSQHNVYSDFFPVWIFLIVAFFIAFIMEVGGRVVSIACRVHKPDINKSSPFECGFPEFEDTRMKFDVRFYLVGILFLIFDLEVTFMVPWGILIHSSGISWSAFIAMMIFIFILSIGFVYEWKKGALEWE